jgi:hypothetical protein
MGVPCTLRIAWRIHILPSSEENGEPLASLWRMSLCGRLGPVFQARQSHPARPAKADIERLDPEMVPRRRTLRLSGAGVASVVPGALSTASEWQPCVVYNGGRFLTLKTEHKIEDGMSGSPIIDDKGAAIGVISTARDGDFNFDLGPILKAKGDASSF